MLDHLLSLWEGDAGRVDGEPNRHFVYSHLDNGYSATSWLRVRFNQACIAVVLTTILFFIICLFAAPGGPAGTQCTVINGQNICYYYWDLILDLRVAIILAVVWFVLAFLSALACLLITGLPEQVLADRENFRRTYYWHIEEAKRAASAEAQRQQNAERQAAEAESQRRREEAELRAQQERERRAAAEAAAKVAAEQARQRQEAADRERELARQRARASAEQQRAEEEWRRAVRRRNEARLELEIELKRAYALVRLDVCLLPNENPAEALKYLRSQYATRQPANPTLGLLRETEDDEVMMIVGDAEWLPPAPPIPPRPENPRLLPSVES